MRVNSDLAASTYMACVCSPAIDAEMRNWIAVGGGNSGCCGNAAHTFGFHLPGYAVPASDYSRSHESAAPYNMSWASAGDFGHRGSPALRARHAALLGRLMNGELPMICEFIGQPWVGRPVYYWARWNGVQTLKRYTGSGHDSWSHISWWRSRANERAYLWTSAPGPTPEHVVTFPPYPGYVLRFHPRKIDANLMIWQRRMIQRGWNLGTTGVDGVFGPRVLQVVRSFQAEKRLAVDGEIGQHTWTAAWTSKVT